MSDARETAIRSFTGSTHISDFQMLLAVKEGEMKPPHRALTTKTILHCAPCCCSHHANMSLVLSEKTGLRGFRPGPTQTGLYSHRRWLEA